MEVLKDKKKATRWSKILELVRGMLYRQDIFPIHEMELTDLMKAIKNNRLTKVKERSWTTVMSFYVPVFNL